MSALGRFESFLEQMVEGSVARFFRSQIQPSEIARRLERAMEAQQTISVSRVIVPNVYRVFLHPSDFVVLQPIHAELEREMATYLVDLARERGFSMIDHPLVELSGDEAVPRRVIQVVAEAGHGQAGQAQSTQVMQAPAINPPQHVPQPQPPRAQALSFLQLHTSGGAQRIPLESTYLRVGRGLDNDIILEDSRVSRYHAQLNYRARRFYISDVGSTNGTFVNGERIGDHALRDGDVISLGGLELVYREN
jgi:sulfur carrier protein ThiS